MFKICFFGFVPGFVRFCTVLTYLAFFSLLLFCVILKKTWLIVKVWSGLVCLNLTQMSGILRGGVKQRVVVIRSMKGGAVALRHKGNRMWTKWHGVEGCGLKETRAMNNGA